MAEKLAVPVKPPPAPSVVVTPIKPEQSRTLRDQKWLAWGAVALTAVPEIVAFLLEMLGDPAVAVILDKYMPLSARAAFTAVLLAVARRGWNRRMDTAQPIAGSSGEAKAKEKNT